MARFCTACGKDIPDGVAFCTECGAKAPANNETEVKKENSAPEASACKQCGTELKKDSAFCTECGTPSKEEKTEEPRAAKTETMPQEQRQHRPPQAQSVYPSQQPVYQTYAQPAYHQPQPVYQQPAYQQPVYPQQPQQQTYQAPPTVKDESNGVVGTGVFFGTMLLFALPIIGFIACIVMCFAPKRKSLKNYAKANLIWAIIGLVFSILLTVGIIALGGSLMQYFGEAMGGSLGGLYGVQ